MGERCSGYGTARLSFHTASGPLPSVNAAIAVPISGRKVMRAKKRSLAVSSNWAASVMLHPSAARKPDMAATIPRRVGQVTVRTNAVISRCFLFGSCADVVTMQAQHEPCATAASCLKGSRKPPERPLSVPVEHAGCTDGTAAQPCMLLDRESVCHAGDVVGHDPRQTHVVGGCGHILAPLLGKFIWL
jgi:hypothetical protein